MRRALLRAVAGMVYGGLPPRRVDQQIPSSGAGVAPGPASGIFRGRQVVVFGTGAGVGFFEYNGQPAGPVPGPANPPVAYAAPPGVTKDPFGNVLPGTGGGFVTVSGTHFAQLQGTQLTFHDPGNTADPFLAGVGSNLNLNSGTTAGAPNQAGLQISPGGVPQLIPNLGTVITSLGIATPGAASPGNAMLFADTNGFQRMLSGLAGDTSAYQLGEDIQTSGGFTINSASPQAILSRPVGIGLYVVEVWLVTSNTTAADAAGFAFTGPAAGVQLMEFESKTTGTAVVGYGASAAYTTQFNGQGVAGNQGILMRALIEFTAAGTLAITGKELVAGNTVTVFGGWMRSRHVS